MTNSTTNIGTLNINPAPKSSSGGLKISTSVMNIFAIFMFVVVSYVSINKMDEPRKYLTSPITLITIVFLFALVMGFIRLDLKMGLLFAALLVLTIYQGKIDQLVEDLKDDWKLLMEKTGHYDVPKDVKPEIIKKFHEQYAEYKGSNVKVTLAKIDEGELNIPFLSWDRLRYNYYMVITPDIQTVRTEPLADTSNEKITMRLKQHIAEVPIMHNGKIYWVVTRAYVFKYDTSKDWRLYFPFTPLNIYEFYKLSKKLRTEIMPSEKYHKFLREEVLPNLVTMDEVLYKEVDWV